MSSSRRPWYPWYPKDFIVDEKVQSLSDDAELVYRRALDVLWQANDLQMPSNCLRLAQALARGWSSERFEKAWSEIQMAGFELLKTTDDGQWVYSKRLKEEAAKIENICEIRRLAGKKGGEKTTKANAQANAKQMLKLNSSHPDPYPDTYKKNKPPLPPKDKINYPDWINLKLWKDFLDHRKSIRKPIKTKKAEQLNINRLKELMSKGHTQECIINLAIEKGWQSLYEPKNDSSGIIKPTTYAQCQDYEKRQQLEFLKRCEEERNAKSKSGSGNSHKIEHDSAIKEGQ